jgi:hypothetical protein
MNSSHSLILIHEFVDELRFSKYKDDRDAVEESEGESFGLGICEI